MFSIAARPLRATVKNGKVAIGLEFALRKLLKIKGLEGAERDKLVQDTRARVKSKGIVLPSFMAKALALLASEM